MCHDLKPIADRSKVMCYDQKQLKFGLFVLFYDPMPLTNGKKVVGYGLGSLKIGKKVMCQDLKPINDRSEVLNQHFAPANGRSEVTYDDFRCVAANDGFYAWHFRCFHSVRQGPCRAENPYAETALAVSKQLNSLTIKLFCNEKKVHFVFGTRR